MSPVFTQPATIADMIDERINPEPESADLYVTNSKLLPAQHELALAAARPRLLRFARKQGVPIDAADDVVQETLLEAWRHLDRLHTPQGIDTWLNKICWHVCLRWLRAQRTILSRQTSLSSVYPEDHEAEQVLERDIADPLAFDPLEELSRQDLVSLLACALGHLPQSTRGAIELCYLAELPQGEAALRLGVTVNALQVRLHRACRQLRQVLSSELRAEAEMFGLTFEQEEASGWRETRMWCNLCGRSRLQGLFEEQPTGRIHLRLRCPYCSPSYGDMFNSGLVDLAGWRSILPAFKRAWNAAAAYWAKVLAEGGQRCTSCQTPLIPLQIGHPAELSRQTGSIVFPPHVYRMVLNCPRCGIFGTCSVASFLNHPHILDFMNRHPRWIIGPEAETEYEGQAAISTCLLDLTSTERLTVIAHRRTLQTLALFHN